MSEVFGAKERREREGDEVHAMSYLYVNTFSLDLRGRRDDQQMCNGVTCSVLLVY